MKLHTLILLLALSCFPLAFMSCTPTPDAPDASKEKTITLSGLTSTHWVYFSFAKGIIVGTSNYGSATDDAAWQNRLDWDIALCADKVKTNSGTSGKGKGGMLIDHTHSFEEMVTAPTTGYSVDELQ